MEGDVNKIVAAILAAGKAQAAGRKSSEGFVEDYFEMLRALEKRQAARQKKGEGEPVVVDYDPRDFND